jgi:hypothetical protein
MQVNASLVAGLRWGVSDDAAVVAAVRQVELDRGFVPPDIELIRSPYEPLGEVHTVALRLKFGSGEAAQSFQDSFDTLQLGAPFASVSVAFSGTHTMFDPTGFSSDYAQAFSRG